MLVRIALGYVSMRCYNVTCYDPTRLVFAHGAHIERGILGVAWLHLMLNATARECTAERIRKLVYTKHLI